MTPRTARIVAQTIGLTLVAIGCWQLHWAVSAVVVGVVLFSFGVHATIWSVRK